MVPRRVLLRVLGMAVTGGLAGCNTITDGDPTMSPTQQRTPTMTPMTTLTPTRTNPPPASSTDTVTTTMTPTLTPSPTPTSSPTPTLAETHRTPGLTAADTEVTEFGRAVALSTDTAIVLAEKDGAFVFERDDGWSQTTVLRTDDDENFGGFNLSVTVVEKVALIGGPEAGPEAGKGMVYLYERLGEKWRQRHQFTAVNEDRDEFGRAVDYDGDRLVVGDANEPTTMVSWIGNAYVFAGDGTNWTRETKITTGNQDLFGTAVTVDGDDVLVGAPRAVPSENQTGAVYAYRRDETDWQRDSMFTPADSSEDALFGQAVDIDGNMAVIGAPGNGSAYVFERAGSEWQRRARLESPADGGRFGQAVGVLGRTVVVGAPKEGNGRAYVFSPADDWTRPRRLLDPRLPEKARFGTAIDVADATALVGAPIYNATSGAYLFDL